MAIKQVYQTEDGGVFESNILAVHHDNVITLAKRLCDCPNVTQSWPYDGMMTAAKWLYDQERIGNNLPPVYRKPEVEEKEDIKEGE